MKLTKIAKILKFVSKMDEASENVLMVAVRFNVVQIHFVQLMIIVPRVFVLKATKEIP